MGVPPMAFPRRMHGRPARLSAVSGPRRIWKVTIFARLLLLSYSVSCKTRTAAALRRKRPRISRIKHELENANPVFVSLSVLFMRFVDDFQLFSTTVL